MSSEKKWMSSEDDSEAGETHTAPMIVEDPDSLMPEKGILKRNLSLIKMASLDAGSSCESDADIVPYKFDEDEDESEEIKFSVMIQQIIYIIFHNPQVLIL